MGNDAHQFTEQYACRRTECECDQAERNDLQRIPVKECFRAGSRTYGSTEQDNYDVHKSVGRRIRQLSYYSGFPEQVTEHQHTYKGSSGRKDQTYDDRYDNREQYLLQFGNRTKLRHFDFSFFFRCQQLHDRGLDNRHQ